jgi:hypothetical protein
MRQRHLLTNWKKFFLRTTQPEPPKQLETATAWLGQLSQGGRIDFSERVGYSGVTWAGAFIDCVFHDAGLVIPSVTYPASGLAEFIKTRRVVEKPQPGDIVFFVFATGSPFQVMHVGLVADVREWETAGLVGTIEGDVSSGLAKSDPSLRGVFRRIRDGHEILAFARVQPAPTIKQETGQPAPILDVRRVTPGRRNKDIGLVQLALKQVTGLIGETPDMFDGQTKSAYARWQRITGRVGADASGIPDRASLQLLGERTRKFQLDA